MRPLSQEGSAFIGTYEYQVKQSPWDGTYSIADENNNPYYFILTLNEDGTGSWNHDNLNESIVWKEEDGGAAIYYPEAEAGSAARDFFHTNENGNLILDMVMRNGEIYFSYDEEYGTWIKTA